MVSELAYSISQPNLGAIMTQTISPGLGGLRATIEGSVITPDSTDYDQARKLWNALHDKRPAVIVRCLSPEDVAAAVAYAANTGLEIAVRGGAHSLPGMSTCDHGLMIDLSRMNSVTVDAATKRARAGGGALMGDLDVATQAHGLAVPTGLIGHTGIGGLTLGGGMGWLTRQAGLTIDNLISAQVVLADQRIVRASEDENPDLFWALRGGGGNFGVVTEFEFRLHEVGPIVQFGLFFWPHAEAIEALRVVRDICADLPRSVNCVPMPIFTAPPAPFVPLEHHGELGCALLVGGFGEQKDFDDVTGRIKAGRSPLVEYVTPMPYTAMQSAQDESNAWGLYAYDKGAYVADFTDEVIAIITEYAPRRTSPSSIMPCYRLDAAYSEVDDEATAFGGGRTPRYGLFLTALCATEEMLVADRAWARSLWEDLEPHLLEGFYANAADSETRASTVYGSKYQRLVAIKSKYDPQNLFHRNLNILPAGR